MRTSCRRDNRFGRKTGEQKCEPDVATPSRYHKPDWLEAEPFIKLKSNMLCSKFAYFLSLRCCVLPSTYICTYIHKEKKRRKGTSEESPRREEGTVNERQNELPNENAVKSRNRMMEKKIGGVRKGRGKGGYPSR